MQILLSSNKIASTILTGCTNYNIKGIIKNLSMIITMIKLNSSISCTIITLSLNVYNKKGSTTLMQTLFILELINNHFFNYFSGFCIDHYIV